MDSPPVPKPRTVVVAPSTDLLKQPVPLPRRKLTNNSSEKNTASDILQSIGSVSKQITEDVAQKVQSSAKSVNERIEKSFSGGSKFARGTLEKTLSTSRAVRNSVIEGTKTAGMRLRRSKKFRDNDSSEESTQRCVSLSAVDASFFDNIQFHSPLLDQKKFYTNKQVDNLDDLSLFSVNSDSNTDTISSLDSREFDHNLSILTLESEPMTYDTPKVSRSNSIMSSPVIPELPERRKNKDSSFDYMRQNSLYENWNLPGEPLLVSVSDKARKSTLSEFDPLNLSTPKFEGVSNELLLYKAFLTNGTYGTIIGKETSEDSIHLDFDNNYFSPPTPPERSDSLVPENDNTTNCENEKNNSNWFINESSKSNTTEVVNKPTNSSVMQKFSNMLKLDMLHKSNKPQSQKILLVEKPSINNYVHYYSGMLTVTVHGTSGVEDLFKNSQTRHCVLSDQKLKCYTDPTNTVLKEVYSLDNVLSTQIVLPLSSSTSNNYNFELSLNNSRGPRKVVMGCSSAPERRNWAQKIAEHLTTGFEPKYTAEFTRCGWCYLKEEVSGEWQGSWVMLIRRVLVYTKDDTIHTVDLRKTRCVVTQEADEDTKSRCGAEGGPNLLLDCPHATLYLRFANERELKGWRYMVKLAVHNNGAYIHHQQLTRENVPTLVDKCIAFIYAHGSMTEGIYRRAGSTCSLTDLLARLRTDAWSVHLSPSHHSEHDVASALKRFFRELPEPLLPSVVHQELVRASEMKDDTTRCNQYRQLMHQLPSVSRETARKLFAHLHFIHTLSTHNKMSAENLAAVWAPTIMPCALTSKELQTAWSATEVRVVRDLIAHYDLVWQPNSAERKREEAVKRVLERINSQQQLAPRVRKAAGDLKVWIYVKERGGECCQATLTPNKTSEEICVELCEKAKIAPHQLMIEEVVCNETLRRIVHKDEVVLDVVLRWGYWDDSDRKDNYLLLVENTLLHQIEALKVSSASVCGELKFANESSKTFKSAMFDVKAGMLACFKDKQGSQKLQEWRVSELLWYRGHETRRVPPTRWAITCVPRVGKTNRSKERPFFGTTLAGAVTEDQIKWLAGLMFAEYSEILPTPRLVIT